MMDERVSDEIEALEAILMDDVNIQYNHETNTPEMIQTVVFPSTGEDAELQYVCITLQVWLTEGYPDNAPIIKLRNSRGLDDSLIDIIERAVDNKMQQCLGQPVVFELIEVIREHLTDSNLPSGQCVICLYGFQEGDLFTKTSCYHYFHSHCLACHLVAAERNHKEEQEKLPAWQRLPQNSGFKALCPVCREHITCDLDSLLLATPPMEVEKAQKFELTADLKDLQAKMSELYLHQQSKGGIIDIEAEQNKLLLTTVGQDDVAENNEIVVNAGAVSQSTDQQNNVRSNNQHQTTERNQHQQQSHHNRQQQQQSEQNLDQSSQQNNEHHKNHNKNIYKGGHYRNHRGGHYRGGRGGNQSRRQNQQRHNNVSNPPCASTDR